MPRAKKDHSCLNIKIDAELYRKLMEVMKKPVRPKQWSWNGLCRDTFPIMIRNSGFCARLKPDSLCPWKR